MYRPRLISPPIVDGDVIRMGDQVAITDDEAGHIRRLLRLLDGTRSAPEVAAAMQEHDPSLVADDVAVAIFVLAEAGLLEDADA